MNKAILVIDMPNSCYECPICATWDVFPSVEEYYCTATNDSVNRSSKPDWCPLKPLPEKYEIDRNKCSDLFYEFELEYGYNACIDEILGV